MSKGQTELGRLLKEAFPDYRIYPEYPYYDILQDAIKHDRAECGVYTQHHLKLGRRYKADWVILDLRIVLEFQGEQHYRPVAFGGKDDREQAKKRFLEQRYIDRKKCEIIQEAGWDLIEVPFDARLTLDNVHQWVKARKYVRN